MSNKTTKTNALEVIAQAQMSTAWTIDDLTQQARAELDFIAKMEGAAAIRALRFGILMEHVKHVLPHGQFRTWQLSTFPGVKKSACNNYMRLAQVFIEVMRLNKEEVLALPEAQLELALEQQDKSARTVLEKVAKFVGENSLTELLIKHEIRSVGLKKELAESALDEDDLSKLPLEEQIRIRRERIFGRMSEYFTHIRKTIAKPEDVQLLDKGQIETIKADLAEISQALDTARNAA